MLNSNSTKGLAIHLKFSNNSIESTVDIQIHSSVSFTICSYQSKPPIFYYVRQPIGIAKWDEFFRKTSNQYFFSGNRSLLGIECKVCFQSSIIAMHIPFNDEIALRPSLIWLILKELLQILLSIQIDRKFIRIFSDAYSSIRSSSTLDSRNHVLKDKQLEKSYGIYCSYRPWRYFTNTLDIASYKLCPELLLVSPNEAIEQFIVITKRNYGYGNNALLWIT